MLFTVDKKNSHLNGQDVYVPNFNKYDRKTRNKVNRYIGRRHEESDSIGLQLAIPLFILAMMLVMIFGAVNDNIVLALSGPVLLLSLLFSGIAYEVYSRTHTLPAPKLPIVTNEDIRWKTLLIAFKDDHELWQRTTKIIHGGYFWRLNGESSLSRLLNEVLSAYMMNVNPTLDSAQAVYRSVERIFSVHDQQQLDLQTAFQAAADAKALEQKRLFDFTVQMAEQDTRHLLNVPSATL